MPSSVTVTFEPGGTTVAVPRGTTVLDAARRAGFPLPSTCGGRGTCGDCAVRVLAGSVDPPSLTEAAALASARPGIRLACLLRAESDLTVKAVAPVPVGTAAAERVRGRAAAIAVDLGTTTVSAAPIDGEGREIGVASVVNPQRTYGADVASRISAALEGDAVDLQVMAMSAVTSALAETGADLSGVERVVVAGNTAMTHLAVGAEAAGLSAHPYAGSLRGVVSTSAAAIGLSAVPAQAAVLFLPSMAAFVGGDTTAAVLSTGLDVASGTHVLLDLGTNAEVVVAVDGVLTVASAPAGPAFEAAGLACGSPAVPGAVRDARVERDRFALDVIGAGPATSLCGSGALALVAALLAAGHVDASGRLDREGPLADLFHLRHEVLAVQVAGERGGERDVYLTQLDVRELQLAKAAVATALELTLEAAEVSWEDVESVLLAGAFGTGLDPRLLRALGVLRSGGSARVDGVGNAALDGAAMVAADPGLLARAEAVAAGARGVDLAGRPSFQRTFIAHTDLRELV